MLCYELRYNEFERAWEEHFAVGHKKLPTPDHVYWPDLDVDLTVEILLHPERFPAKSEVEQPGSQPRRE
ncbi:MAG: DUF2442 domain-containing protein [Candidatus Binatia bacterium]